MASRGRERTCLRTGRDRTAAAVPPARAKPGAQSLHGERRGGIHDPQRRRVRSLAVLAALALAAGAAQAQGPLGGNPVGAAAAAISGGGDDMAITYSSSSISAGVALGKGGPGRRGTGMAYPFREERHDVGTGRAARSRRDQGTPAQFGSELRIFSTAYTVCMTSPHRLQG
jgi:hypothetical protein